MARRRRAAIRNVVVTACLVAGVLAMPGRASAVTTVFNFSNDVQTFDVPTGVTSVTIDASGAQGGQGGNGGGAGANGGRVRATLAVTGGETLSVFVGGQGGPSGTPGANGGGAGGIGGVQSGGGGGGASDVRRGGSGLSNRIVVSGGGGGGGGRDVPVAGAGGAGGDLTGEPGFDNADSSANGGGGGTQSDGGPGGTGGPAPDGDPGGLGTGGSGSGTDSGGGGGGGGFYGGGGGETGGVFSSGGGGGGSSFTTPGATGIVHEQGVRAGNGVVTITYSATGDLIPAGCVDDNDVSPDVCAQSVNGLDFPSSVAVSPDGLSVYAASAALDDAIVRFNRSSTGALTPAGCIDDNDTGADVCAQSVNGLNGANDVAVSPDGTSVYVTSGIDNALVRFNRSSTGALTPAGCIDDNDSVDDACVQSTDGLQSPVSVAVSPDGKSVYVGSQNESAIVRFSRSSTGALTPAGCIDDNDSGPEDCGQSVNGLANVHSVTVSPDGLSVYAAAFLDSAVVRFNRSSTGALTPAGCVDDNDSGIDVCAQSVNGLNHAFSVVVSADGTSVYVAARNDHALVRFNRSSTGALTPAGCIDDNDSGADACAQSVNGLGVPFDVTVSPDGKSVYVVSFNDDAVVLFSRSSTGALSSRGCIHDNDTGTDSCAQSANGLDGPNAVTGSPDGSRFMWRLRPITPWCASTARCEP